MSLRNQIFFASSGVFLVGFLTLILAVTFMTQATSQKSGEDLIRKTAEALALDAGKTLAQAQLAPALRPMPWRECSKPALAIATPMQP